MALNEKQRELKQWIKSSLKRKAVFMAMGRYPLTVEEIHEAAVQCDQTITKEEVEEILEELDRRGMLRLI